MPPIPRPALTVAAAVVANLGLPPSAVLAGDVAPDFGREVLPILADRCFHCHGPDPSHRKADLRLDLEEEAKADRGGYLTIAAGDPEASELWQRIVAEDPLDLMPPPDSHREPISEAEREILRRWIEAGAPWGKHWAFEPPQRPELPEADAPDANTHPVDAFVRARLAAEGLQPAPPAPAHTQLRRLSFVLTGLPPAAVFGEESGPFTDDGSPFTEWSQLVERLLASPHHGERLAMWWLDAARYADTDGFQQDAERSNWAWRDWVVEAFNANLPFDRFTVEQFAGDLLPDATPEQILATCFHRNHMTNGEGGRDPEESRIDYVLDRVNTVGTTWLGLTLGCSQCHDHKFDPVPQADYYALSAFFNSIDEDGRAGRNAKPYLDYHSPHTQRAVAEMEAHVAALAPREDEARRRAEARFEGWLAERFASLPEDYAAWRPLQPVEFRSAEGTQFRIDDGSVVQTIGPNPRQDDYRIAAKLPSGLERVAGWRLEALPHESHTGGRLSRGRDGTFILTNVKLLVRRASESQLREVPIAEAKADAEIEAKGRNYGLVKDTLDDDPRNGWTVEPEDTEGPRTAVFALAEPLDLEPDEELLFVLFQRSTEGEANLGRFRLSATAEVGETPRSLETSPLEALAAAKRAGLAAAGNLDPALRERLLAQYLLDDAAHVAAAAELAEARSQLAELKKADAPLGVMVLAEREEPRETHILLRGEWDAKGETVARGGLETLHPWPASTNGKAESGERTRLDLAEWLVSPGHPLTPRVVANHLWQIVFGEGLVRTPEDFGLQGEAPTHPELLDWLAVELVESGWDLRHLLRLLVTSETFRQSSDFPEELRERDPGNRLLARYTRRRLPSWMIRDQALASAGLLNPALGGPPVKPWQPEGVWEEIFMGRFTYRPSLGPAQYRRSLYAYWRRSIAPTFLFDSAERRVCEVSVPLTNTPLQALALMNDVTLLESARALAASVNGERSSVNGCPDAGVQALARRVLSRELSEMELAVLEREFGRALDHYASHPEDALEFASVGQQAAPELDEAPETAAWMAAAGLMLNLDEAITLE